MLWREESRRNEAGIPSFTIEEGNLSMAHDVQARIGSGRRIAQTPRYIGREAYQIDFNGTYLKSLQGISIGSPLAHHRRDPPPQRSRTRLTARQRGRPR